MTILGGAGSMPAAATRRVWLHSARFDSVMLIGSVVIVPAILAGMWLNLPSLMLDLGVTALIGGPHLWATFTNTFADQGFRRRHPFLLASSLLIPIVVVWMAVHRFQILVSMFLVAASVHVLHQCAYIADGYRARAGRQEMRGARWIDYGVLLSSMYPIALYRIVTGNFQMAGVEVIIPAPLMRMESFYLSSAVFAFFLAAWLGKTAHEAVHRTLNGPKTALIGVTVFFSFIVPGTTSGSLGLAFQSMNAWHSLQYLALVWLINTRLAERGELRNRLMVRLTGASGARWFYLWNLAIATVLLLFTQAIIAWNPVGLEAAQYYYMLALSPLLIHYYIDGFLFLTAVSRVSEPEESPAVLLEPARAP